MARPSPPCACSPGSLPASPPPLACAKPLPCTARACATAWRPSHSTRTRMPRPTSPTEASAPTGCLASSTQVPSMRTAHPANPSALAAGTRSRHTCDGTRATAVLRGQQLLAARAHGALLSTPRGCRRRCTPSILPCTSAARKWRCRHPRSTSATSPTRGGGCRKSRVPLPHTRACLASTPARAGKPLLVPGSAAPCVPGVAPCRGRGFRSTRHGLPTNTGCARALASAHGHSACPTLCIQLCVQPQLCVEVRARPCVQPCVQPSVSDRVCSTVCV